MPAALQMPHLHQGDKGDLCFLEDLPPRLLTRIFHSLRGADIDINHHGDRDEISSLH